MSNLAQAANAPISFTAGSPAAYPAIRPEAAEPIVPQRHLRFDMATMPRDRNIRRRHEPGCLPDLPVLDDGRGPAQGFELGGTLLRTDGDDAVGCLQLEPGAGPVDPSPPSLDGEHEHARLGLQLELFE
jgi:hypothetical protein